MIKYSIFLIYNLLQRNISHQLIQYLRHHYRSTSHILFNFLYKHNRLLVSGIIWTQFNIFHRDLVIISSHGLRAAAQEYGNDIVYSY